MYIFNKVVFNLFSFQLLVRVKWDSITIRFHCWRRMAQRLRMPRRFFNLAGGGDDGGGDDGGGDGGGDDGGVVDGGGDWW